MRRQGLKSTYLSTRTNLIKCYKLSATITPLLLHRCCYKPLIFKTMSKLKELQLEVKDLHKHRVEETVLFARCGVTGKEMRLTFYGGIQVWKDGKLIREFVQEFQAVEFFNGL